MILLLGANAGQRHAHNAKERSDAAQVPTACAGLRAAVKCRSVGEVAPLLPLQRLRPDARIAEAVGSRADRGGGTEVRCHQLAALDLILVACAKLASEQA